MINTLYKKLSLILFVILLLVGVALIFIIRYGTEMFQHEAAQKLNYDLAEHIVHENILLQNGIVKNKALKNVFHMLMVINPSIELYLLDTQGAILAFSAPKDRVKRESVNIDKIQKFLDKKATYPFYGDDPRNINKSKIFSAAPIVSKEGNEGYLYVILNSENQDNIMDIMKQSYIVRYSIYGLFAILGIALFSGLLLIRPPTNRLKTLSTVIDKYLNHEKEGNRYPVSSKNTDEIEQLGEHFNYMANKLDKQISEIAINNAKRRELIASVSHDLRTPLTSLYGYLETMTLRADTLTENDKQKYLKIATDQSKRLIQLVSELFELAKLDSVETLLSIEPFSLGELIQDVAQKFELLSSKKEIKIQSEFGQDIPFAFGDIAMIQRVLENLVDNAIRHTRNGGTITLSLNGEQENIRVAISDTGIGIPEEDLPHIFERFFHRDRTTPTDQQGTGLGLAIAKRILSLHGTSIEAKSSVDVGTTFIFQIPTQPVT